MSQGFTRGVPIDNDPTMAANSPLLVPSQYAVVQYIASIIPTSTGVLSVGATAPVTSTGGATPVIGMPMATASQDGYLSAADYVAFSSGSGGVDPKKMLAYIELSY